MEDHGEGTASHHQSSNIPADTGCIPVPLKCGLCEYSTGDVTDLVTHTSTHALQRHPFKCNQCTETFPGYTELQQHPCGDGQFMFLLNSPQADNKSTDISEVPEGEVVDLSASSRKRKENMNIVYGPTPVKQSKADSGKDEGSGSAEKNVTFPLAKKMTLRARMTPQKYNKSMDDDQSEQDVEERQLSEKTQDINTPTTPTGKDTKEKEKNALMICKYCHFKSGYPGNFRCHVELHKQPGRQHFECEVCKLRFLTRRQQNLHDCGFKEVKTPVLKPITTKLKTPIPQPQMSTVNTPILNKPKTPKMKTPTQVHDISNKLDTFSASLVRAGRAMPGNVYMCRLCNFLSTCKSNVTQHVYRHRCMTCHTYLPTLSKRGKHMVKCKKPIVSYSSEEQQITNMWGERLTYRHSSPRTLVHLVCLTCKGTFQYPAEYQVHKCTSKTSTKSAPSKGKAGKKTPLSKADTQKKALTQTKGKSHTYSVPGTFTGKLLDRMGSFDDKLQMYTCNFCLFTNPTPLALSAHLRTHSGTETPLEKTPSIQAQRLEFARRRERERTKPRMEGWDDEAMQYACNLCSFATPTPIVLLNHKRNHKLLQEEQEECTELSEEGGEDDNVQKDDQEQEEEPVNLPVDDEGEDEEDSKTQESKSSKLLMCEVCGFTTKQHWNLQAHTGLHTGTRPFKCHDCNIGFMGHYHLKMHLMKLHGKEDGDAESQHATETSPQENNIESCPQPGCTFSSNSTTAFAQHFKEHLHDMNTSTSDNRPDLSHTPEKANKCSDLSNTADDTSHSPDHSPGKTVDENSTSQNVSPRMAVAKKLTFIEPDNDNETNSPEVASTHTVNCQSPGQTNAEILDKVASGVTSHKDASTSPLGFIDKVSAGTSPSSIQDDMPVFKVPLRSLALPAASSDVSAEPQTQTEKGGKGDVCSLNHTNMNSAKCRPRSSCTPAVQTTTEEDEVIERERMPVLQKVSPDVGRSPQEDDTQDENNMSPCSLAGIPPKSSHAAMGTDQTQEEMTGVWRRPGVRKPLQALQLHPERTPTTPTPTDFSSAATDSTDSNLRADLLTPSISDNGINARRCSMYYTPNGNANNYSTDDNMTEQPINTNIRIAHPIPLYPSTATTVSSDTETRPDTYSKSTVDNNVSTTDTGPNEGIATQPINSNSSTDAQPITSTLPNGCMATPLFDNSSSTDAQPIIDTGSDSSIATHRITDTSAANPHPFIETRAETSLDRCIVTLPAVSYYNSGHTSAPPAATAGGLGAGKRSLDRLHRCAFCAIYFEDLRRFLHHMGRHNPDHPWTCTGCWKNFRNVFAFEEHH